jgi:hypothetical protein
MDVSKAQITIYIQVIYNFLDPFVLRVLTIVLVHSAVHCVSRLSLRCRNSRAPHALTLGSQNLSPVLHHGASMTALYYVGGVPCVSVWGCLRGSALGRAK